MKASTIFSGDHHAFVDSDLFGAFLSCIMNNEVSKVALGSVELTASFICLVSVHTYLCFAMVVRNIFI